MSFTFDKPTAVRLVHVNLREEKHGDESVAAIDLKFVRTHGNDQLALLHPKLKEAFYWRADETEKQGDIDGVEQIAPNLRFPAIPSLVWDLEMTGCSVVVDYGLGKGSNISLSDCKVNNFRVEMSEGGTTDITFRVQTSNFPTGALDKLAGKLGQETQITLWAPTVEPEPVQQELVQRAPKGRKGKTPEEALAESVQA